jgi:hypothetical protein
MQKRRIQCYCGVPLLLFFISTSAWAADQSPLTRTHRGTVVTVHADKLVVQGLSGKKKEHTYEVAPTATILYGGNPCKLMDLKVGQLLTIITETGQDGKALATKIEARDPGTLAGSP